MDNRAVAGAQLEEWLELQETVKSALAEYAGVSPSTVSRWIAGRTRPTGDRLALVALLLSGQAVLKTAPRPLHVVVDLRELVDWVHLYDYCAQDLREALVAVQESYNIRCTLLDKDGELKEWPFPPLVSIEAQGAFLPEIHLSRAQEVEQIRRALLSFKAFREPLHRRVALWGMGGIGKTFLAKTIAMDDDVREHFWDGVLWAELGPEPGQVEQKAARWLPRWGDLLKLDLPADATTWEWQAAIHDKLRHPDRRLLIILDDVWWSEDVEPFIVAGSQTQILLTTRNRAVAARIPDSELLEVPPLSPEESHILLHEWSGAERRREDSNGEYAAELSEVLEAHPLALSLVGSLVK
ncbi:helix-turn-helix domain-containing protein, partial [candidate division KSB3 bacterium]|nr:helix-turn-helix domain-containing protein [candidate division KSB3 bacterium]